MLNHLRDNLSRKYAKSELSGPQVSTAIQTQLHQIKSFIIPEHLHKHTDTHTLTLIGTFHLKMRLYKFKNWNFKVLSSHVHPAVLTVE